MKRTHTAILILALASLTTGCVHVTNMATEIYWNTDNPVAADPDLTLDTLCVVKYAVAERTGQTVIHSQKQIDILLYQFLFDARNNGSSISMQANRTPRGAKLQFADTPVVTFQSSDVGKVKEWAKRMLLKGYRVEIVYDKKSKTYHCTARPKS